MNSTYTIYNVITLLTIPKVNNKIFKLFRWPSHICCVQFKIIFCRKIFINCMTLRLKLPSEMICKAEKLGKAYFVRRTYFLFNFNSLLKSLLVMCCNNYLSFRCILQHAFVVSEIVSSCRFKITNYRGVVAMLLS